jgi:hypothetical protein
MLFATQKGGELIDILKEHDQVPKWNQQVYQQASNGRNVWSDIVVAT